ncbi:MAG: SAM-dependent methyltransferase [Paracoccaceae bacterium]|nr:MAG: SAM-dependent methyltransferase [Paracoccaceae bacterium]
MTPLAAILARRITATGPISVADYMADCLLHPDHGYYATRDPFGAGGDFVTAPEISQMFGELLGLALAQAWLDRGAPAPFVLAELGPGRGTLMADALRATRGVPGFHDAARIVLVEASPVLRRVQAERLAGYRVDWAGTVADLPPGPLFLIANEFFDALPIRQFLRDAGGWRERVVGLSGGVLCFGLSGPVPLPDARFGADPPGTLVETCTPAQAVAAAIAARIAARGGAAFLVDYGGWRSKGDTLQALRGHRREDPLASPGEADLTAHVDFEALAQAAAGLEPSGLTGQGLFLRRLGIEQRAERLARGLQGDALVSHAAALERLTAPAQMGSLFKVLGLAARGTAPLPGLDACSNT